MQEKHYQCKITGKVRTRKTSSWQLQYILKRLLPPQNKTIIHPFGIYIPQICFYKDGQAQSLYLNAEPTQKGIGIREPSVIRIKKQKLTNTQIQKIFNERRRKYRQKVGTLVKYQRKSSQFGKKDPPPETKDAVLICNSTKEESYDELHQENYFIGLMLRRKQDPIFKTIDFIKNFIGANEQDKRIIFCKHKEGQVRYPQVFQRSKSFARVLGSNIIAGQEKYISPGQQSIYLQQLAKENPHCYAYYTLYKIIHFIQHFYDQRITLISAKFLLNQLNELYLLHVYNVEKKDLIKYSWTQDIYLKKVAQSEDKVLRRMPNIDMDQKSQARSGFIQGEMKNQYENLKLVMGLAEVEKNDQEEQNNNAFFAKLYPNVGAPISELLKDKTMTVHKFQKTHMGYFRNKKPVAAPFSSNLVKTLHKMTPILKTARPHNIQSPLSSSFCKRGWTSKRSYSQGNTISTVHKTMTILM